MPKSSAADKIEILYDIEAIKKLKHRYWRCNDMKLMDEIGGCFSARAFADYGPGIQLEGREAIVSFLRENMGRKDLISIHQGFNPEIEITGRGSATGRWGFYNYMSYTDAGIVMHIWARYDDEYIKERGVWKIRSTKITYTLTETVSRSLPGPSGAVVARQ